MLAGSFPDNPLLIPVLQLLQSNPSGLSEYELIQALEAAPGFPELADEPELALYRKHFLVMNALYRLRDSLWADGRQWLDISPLAIVLRSAAPSVEAAGTAVSEPDPLSSDAALRDYYLDWSHLARTSSQDVQELLAAFWRRCAGEDQRADALAILELPADADRAMIRRRYRQLAGRHHPDRGGEHGHFLAIRAAYEVLCGTP